MDETTSLSPKGINWSSALVAGLVATVAITITMALFGTNIMKMLGSTMLGENASVAAQYTVGGMLPGSIFHVPFRTSPAHPLSGQTCSGYGTEAAHCREKSSSDSCGDRVSAVSGKRIRLATC